MAASTGGATGKTFFCNSGAEANEAAIRIARRYTGRHKVLTHYRSYHGGTASACAPIGSRSSWRCERP